MEVELNILKKTSLTFAAIASVLTFAPDIGFINNQAKAEFPTKPIKVYVGFKPGGRTDMIARLIAKHITEKKLLSQYKNIKHFDFQGSTWAPHLIHKDLWNKVGGFSEEFYPGTGSDPDLNMKLWNEGVRIFKGLQYCKVYHFGSIVTRQKEKKFNAITESGSRGSKLFLIKWGISIKFFKKHFLKSDIKYTGSLKEPLKNFQFYFDLLICKFYYFYLKFFFKP